MDFIIAKYQGGKMYELGELYEFEKLYADLGDTNKLQLTIPSTPENAELFQHGTYIYAPGTEYGGRLDRMQVDTRKNTITWEGLTWRGILNAKIIEPPVEQDYRYSGYQHANYVIQDLIGLCFTGTLFTNALAEEEVIIRNYQFERYCTLLDGITTMLDTVGAHLTIRAISDADGVQVEIGAKLNTDYSDLLTQDQDGGVNFTIDDFRGAVNHLIILGSGNLSLQKVLHLYSDGVTISQDPKLIKGLEPVVQTYALTSEGNDTKLITQGTAKLKELINYKSLSAPIEDEDEEVDVDIGDIVGGTDFVTGTEIKSPVITKMLTSENGMETITYKTKGE